MVRSPWFLVCLILLAVLGCTSVRVESEPRGARVEMTEFHGVFGWTEWKDRGQTPLAFSSPQDFQIRLRWPDGSRSEIRQVPWRASGGGMLLRFSREAGLPVVPQPPIPVLPEPGPAGSGSLGENVHLASLAAGKKHHELIRDLEAKTARGEKLNSFQSFLLAAACVEIRDYQKALPALDRLEQGVLMGDCVYFGSDLSPYVGILRGMVALDLGDPARAADEASRANGFLNRERRSPNAFHASELIEIAGVLGVAHAQLGHPAEAMRCVAALEDIETGGSVSGPDKFAAIARIHMALRQWDKALAAVQDPRAKVGGLVTLFYNQTFQELPKLFVLTKCWYEVGRTREAKEGYDQLLRHPRIQELGGLYWPILLDRARIGRREGQPALAEDLLRRAVEVVERQRASIHTEAGRIGYVGDKQEVYQELVSLLVGADRPGEAFGFVERAKGRALVDLLASQKAFGRPAQDHRVAELDLDYQVIPEAAASSQRAIAITARGDLQREAPELASLVIVPEVKPAGLQARLAADETLLEYYAAGVQWLAFVVTRETLTVTRLQARDLGSDVLALRRALADPSRQTPEAEGLYLQLLAPVAAQLRTPRLIIVPHGVLHYVPFCALGPRDAPILERFSLRVLPSATVLAFLKPAKAGGDSLILGNPDLGNPALDLPFAQDEATALARILPRPTLLVGKSATAGPVRAAGARYGIIHLAAHGFFDDKHPLDSALLLAPTAQDPGALKVADLYRLQLDTELVTLSACETALSKVSSGDDVVGFTRGLLFAGSRSVLSSLWKVDDQCTRDLMVGLYTRLAGADKAEALRQAQLAVRAGHPHPYYWAAFTLNGN
jgi:CHAT domain-containing protein